MKILISGGTIVSDGKKRKTSVVIENDSITEITDSDATPRDNFDRVVDATGCYVLPGVIDSHVHFREPGMERKADIASESRAAAFGGVTSYLEMPNTVPQTTTAEALAAKMKLGQEKSSVNYAFFPGATNDNTEFLRSLDVSTVPGIKLFMGSSTGNMLVDKREALDSVFALAAEKSLPVVAHCEDTGTINRNMAEMQEKFGRKDPPLRCHPQIRSVEACLSSTALGIEMAQRHGAHFHVAHVSSAEVLSLCSAAAKGEGILPSEHPSKKNNGVGKARISVEACLPHLVFSKKDYYGRQGARIKCNPAVQAATDRDALRLALCTGQVQTIATDHAPHLLCEKEGGAAKAVSGMPMVQFSLPAMLTLVSEGEDSLRGEGSNRVSRSLRALTIEKVVELMSHNPARLFGIERRGFLKEGFKADVAIVRPEEWTVTDECVESKCGWTPLAGRKMKWRVAYTLCNGHIVYDDGKFDAEYRGEALRFQHG